MAGLFSRSTLREDRFLRNGLVLSVAVSLFLLLIVDTPSGEYFGGYTDHLHHSRATYNFFVVGLEVYRVGHGYVCQRVPYSSGFEFWPFYPVAYPPGMFVVFAIPGVIGRFPILSVPHFGKLVITYLTIINHFAIWAFVVLGRRVQSTFWMFVVAFVWSFLLRTSVLGFYDGAWILTAALGVHCMAESRPARAVVWFLVAALTSYRAVSIAPLAAIALWQLLRGESSLRTKALVTLASIATGGIVVACFWALAHYGPHDTSDSAHSPLLPFKFYTWFILLLGLVVAAVLAYGTSLLVGACVVFSTLLGIYHGGHSWHGTVCLAPLFALVLASRRPLWAQVLLALWLAFNLEYVFGFAPYTFLDDLLFVIERGGGVVR